MTRYKNAITALAGAALLATLGAAFAEQSMGAMKLDDAQIAQIAVTADDIDIAYAHLALAVSKNPEVRSFAGTMIADHGAVNAKAAALAKKLGVTPRPSEMSRQLEAGARAKMDELSRLRGEAFDRAYAKNELAYHRAVNEAVRKTLIPGASNAELKKLLESAVPIFLGHERHAERLDGAVNGGM